MALLRWVGPSAIENHNDISQPDRRATRRSVGASGIGHTGRVTTIGFLHTSPRHSATFRALVEELLPGADVIEVVDEMVLDQARRLGEHDVRVLGAIADRLAELVGADVVVCTCSTLGAVAERVGRAAGSEVIRVDRAMVQRAVEIAGARRGRVAVVAALESTLGPTTDLFDEVMLATGAMLQVDVHVIDGAWDRFEAGDPEAYLDAIASRLPAIAVDVDVVVLAQASMAAAVGRVEVDTPILSSPRLAIESLRADST